MSVQKDDVLSYVEAPRQGLIVHSVLAITNNQKCQSNHRLISFARLLIVVLMTYSLTSQTFHKFKRGSICLLRSKNACVTPWVKNYTNQFVNQNWQPVFSSSVATTLSLEMLNYIPTSKVLLNVPSVIENNLHRTH